MSSEEIFVGREKEIEQFFEFLRRKENPAFIVIGEPGIGKSSFLKEVVKRIRERSKDSGVFVGFHEVLDGTTNEASPFVRVLDDLMMNLSIPLREKAEEETKRALSVVKRIFSEEGKLFAKSMIKSFVAKWLDIVAEIKDEKVIVEVKRGIEKSLDENTIKQPEKDRLLLLGKGEEKYDKAYYFFEEEPSGEGAKEYLKIIRQTYEKYPELAGRVFVIIGENGNLVSPTDPSLNLYVKP